MATTDPASRLVGYLKKYAQFAKTHGGPSAKDAWAFAFGIDGKDVALIYYNLGQLHSLVDDIQNEIRNVPGINHERYLEDIEGLKIPLRPRSLTDDCKKPLDQITDGVIARLEFCSDQLMKETVIEPATLDELRAGVDELLESVRTSKINKALRHVLMDLLNSVRQTIFEYDKGGLKVLNRSLCQIIGAMALSYGVIEKAEPELSKKFDGFVARLGSAVQHGANMTSLLSYAGITPETIARAGTALTIATGS